ncbi:response regulator transcription factor [Hyphomicrobium sp.]|uniref:response regulator transcription factor n=1 Tax=Hyphomicrobium sp. TaxID=82 RepID=UPI003F6EAB76
MKILVVDDHAVIRNGIRQLFAREPDVYIFEASDAKSAIPIARDMKPDLVILDMKLNGVSGIEVLRRIKAHDRAAKVLIFTAYADPAMASRAIRTGAFGYVTKSSPLEVLRDAISQVMKGERYVDASMSEKVSLFCATSEDALNKLTNREQEILRLLGEGKSLQQVATEMGSAYKTIANASSRIKEKLDLCRTSDLIRFYMENYRE